MEYRMVLQGGEGEITEKKSRFIATVRPVKSEEEAAAFIESVRKQYWDARHNCYAYVIGERQEVQRYSDDGEPGGTAGRPMLDVLLGEPGISAAPSSGRAASSAPTRGPRRRGLPPPGSS